MDAGSITPEVFGFAMLGFALGMIVLAFLRALIDHRAEEEERERQEFARALRQRDDRKRRTHSRAWPGGAA